MKTSFFALAFSLATAFGAQVASADSAYVCTGLEGGPALAVVDQSGNLRLTVDGQAERVFDGVSLKKIGEDTVQYTAFNRDLQQHALLNVRLTNGRGVLQAYGNAYDVKCSK